MTLNDLLAVPYVDGGRDLTGLDCYGQVWFARHHVINRPLSRSYSHILCANKLGMTEAFFSMLPNFEQVPAHHGAVGCCFKKDADGQEVLLHVGLVVLVDGQLKVLNTNAKSGPELMSLRHFNRLALEVKFYDDCLNYNLPK
ncbi:hypothetical protein A6E13_16345 [Aliivibrio fischeri]|nr:hypothetical protein A6E13_16345 [Aliivibrio fischeri]